MKVKIFTENSTYDLQKEVNQWLEKNQNLEIVFINQSESAINIDNVFNWGVTISIWYK